MPHIQIRDLNISYGSHRAVKNVSMDIPDSRITAIIGPSGCGKTTLLKSINRLIDMNDNVQVAGAVLIDGENILAPIADLSALRKKVGFLSQRPYPLPMSIADNVLYGPRLHRAERGVVREQISELEKNCPLGLDCDKFEAKKHGHHEALVECYLSLAGLWDEVKDRLDRPATQLSIGQLQRLALARALAVGPEAVLADEPTSALDPISAQLIENQFRLLKKNYTIVIVTHGLRQALRLADYVAFMYLGELIEHGPAHEVLNSPKNERTRAYVQGEFD
jgi:phosphate transport system ATP-binding protein